jgi:anaerobic ribonucleoside-triphosphate reductase
MITNKIKVIEKRNGSIVDFDQNKITTAVLKALKVVYKEKPEDYLKKVAEIVSSKVVCKLNYKGFTCPKIEEIQDIVENTLMEMGEKEAAKEYIRYRLKQQEIRERKKSLIQARQLINNYILQDDWRVKENANMGFSLQGMNNHIVSDVTKSFWLEEVYSEPIKDAHVNGDFHIHDLGLLAPYCCGWNLEDFLLKGFGGVSGKIESKPPKHFRTALLQLVNLSYTLQGEAAGAQAVSNFTTYLAPFVRHDGLTYNEVKQALQEFVFNLNVPTRVGFQTPFVNLTMDLKCPNILKGQPVIIGGEYRFDMTYGDFEKEIEMINLAFAEVMMEGDAKGRIFSFPIPSYNVTDDWDWESEVVNKIFEMAGKYGIPYFTNFLSSDLSPDDIRSMCCRLRLDNRELRKRGGGLFGANPLTGSIGVVTINFARLGYLSKSKEEFYERLKRLMDMARDSLKVKRKIIEQNTEMGLYPYSRYYLQGVYQRFGRYWSNHFSTIGINGMNECIMNFYKKVYNRNEDITTPEGLKFANEVLDYMRDVISQYQEEDEGILYNLEATPAEGTAYRLARLDKKQFPDIITAGKDEPYYTNSTALPVGFTDDIFQALNLQEELQTKYTGGTVFHAFLGERIANVETAKALVKKILTNYRIPYLTLSPTFSICDNHGYLKGEQHVCPECGKETEIWTRVVGFHRPVQNWNKGKQEEFKDRETFSVAKAL